MVESVTNTAISTLLRAQSTGVSSSGVAALKSNKQAAQAIMQQFQEISTQAKTSGASNQLVTTAAAQTPSSNLPRGSLVDMLV